MPKLSQTLEFALKYYVTHVYGLTVYMKQRLLFGLDSSAENSDDAYSSFRSSPSLCTVFNPISSNIHKVVSIKFSQ